MRSRQRGSRAVIAVAVAVVTLLSACTSGGPMSSRASATRDAPGSSAAPSASPPGSDAVLQCDGAIHTGPPPASFRIVQGVVALPASPDYPALQTSRTGDGSGGPRLFAKTGLVIKSATSFELVVPTRLAGHFGIGWGASAIPSPRVVVSDCPSQGGDGWLAYPGGYWIDHPACVAIIVKTATTQTQVEVGLGTPCPGQRPPEGVSQS